MLSSVHPFSVYAVKVHVLMRHEPKQREYIIEEDNSKEEFYYEKNINVENVRATAWVASIRICAHNGSMSHHMSHIMRCQTMPRWLYAREGTQYRKRKMAQSFGNTINPLDTQGLYAEAESKLKALDIKSLDLYVTGLTVALISVLNACRQLGIVVTLYHYDREEGNYCPQKVL